MPEPSTNPTPELLKAARFGAGLTQPALADIMGVAPMTISAWETGRSDIKSRDLRLFAEVCRVEPGDLLEN